jgi:YD repeat-containing protein
MVELASELPGQIGRDIPRRNLSGEDYAVMRLGFGLSQTIVAVTIDAKTKAISRRPGEHVSRSQRTHRQTYDNASRRGKKHLAGAAKSVEKL